MSKDQAQPSCSPQDQIHWGILFLTRQLRNLRQHEREQCLQEVWEWARRRADLLCLQIIRDYRECHKESGPTYLRHVNWFWSKVENDPEFRTEWERRFPRWGMKSRRRASVPDWAGVSPGTRAEEVKVNLRPWLKVKSFSP